jgi:hypothetical protein
VAIRWVKKSNSVLILLFKNDCKFSPSVWTTDSLCVFFPEWRRKESELRSKKEHGLYLFIKGNKIKASQREIKISGQTSNALKLYQNTLENCNIEAMEQWSSLWGKSVWQASFLRRIEAALLNQNPGRKRYHSTLLSILQGTFGHTESNCCLRFFGLRESGSILRSDSWDGIYLKI